MRDKYLLKGQVVHWLTLSYAIYYYAEIGNTSNLLCLLIISLLSLLLVILNYTRLEVRVIGTIYCIHIDMICLIILNANNISRATYAQLIITQGISKDMYKQIKNHKQMMSYISPASLYYGIIILLSLFQQIFVHFNLEFNSETPQLIACLLVSLVQSLHIVYRRENSLVTTTQLDTGPLNKIEMKCSSNQSQQIIKRVISNPDLDKQLYTDRLKDSSERLIDNFSNIKSSYINSEVLFQSLEYLHEGLILLEVIDEKHQPYRIQYMNNGTRMLFGKDQEMDILYTLEGLNNLRFQDSIDDPISRRDSILQKLGNLNHSKLCRSVFLPKDYMFGSVKQPLMEVQMIDKLQTISMRDLLDKLIKSKKQDFVTVNTFITTSSILQNTNKNITTSQSCANGFSKYDTEKLLEFTLTITKDKSILILCRDVTHRQKIRYLREYDIQKSKMLSFVSHEYRQPLGCIIQMIECVLQQSNIRNNPEITENLQAAMDNSHYMLNLSNDLLDLAQIKNGKFKISSIPFSLDQLIGECLKMFALKAKIKGLKLECNFDQQLPKQIISDKNRIKQIIVNLLSNAFKFTCGKIEIIVKKQSQQRLRIGVRDDGIGISEEEQKVLFKAFSKVNSEESKKLNEQGVGLGLVISNQIAQTIGCSGLNIESNKDKIDHFSFFYFDVQIEEPQKKKVSSYKVPKVEPMFQEVEEITTFDNQKITQDYISTGCSHYLIVDDDCFNVFAFKKLLNEQQKNISLQFDVESVLSGKESIQKVRDKKCCNQCQGYKLIFMDVEMPQMNGLQTTKQILSINPNQIIVGCSGYSDQSERQKCLDIGMTDYLVKPVTEKELFEILRKYQ